MGWLSIGADKEDIRIYNAGHCARDASKGRRLRIAKFLEKNTSSRSFEPNFPQIKAHKCDNFSILVE